MLVWFGQVIFHFQIPPIASLYIYFMGSKSICRATAKTENKSLLEPHSCSKMYF